MIDGFENETKPLTELEQSLVQKFVNSLQRRTKANPCSNAYIIRKFSERGIKLTGARIRKIINHIRTHHLVNNLVADNKGYYVTQDPAEVERYTQSLYQRAEAIINVAKSFVNGRT